MRAKGRINLTGELLKGMLGIPKNIALDKIYIDDTRDIVSVVVSSDAPAYVGDGIHNIRPVTYNVAEGQEVPTWQIDTLNGLRKGELK